MSSYDPSIGEMISLDPAHGIRSHVGIAYWKAGILAGAGAVALPRDAHDTDDGERAQRMAHAALAWIGARHALPRTFVYEWPQVYTAAKSIGDPNDLIGLAGVGAAVGMGLSMAVALQEIGLTIMTYRPGEWTGGIRKERKGNPWLSLRGQRVATRLRSSEREVVPASHDAIDAVGIGLFALGRFEPKRVFPGAT